MPQAIVGLCLVVTAWLLGCSSSPALPSSAAPQLEGDAAIAETDSATAADASSYELVSIEGCVREPIVQGLAIMPIAFCDWSPTEPDRRICSRDESIGCLRASDCAAQPFGHCEAAVSSQCNYPRMDGPCETDADCTALPEGSCLQPLSTELFCDGNGNDCQPPAPLCHYQALNQSCTTDDECQAAAGGFCDRHVWTTRCVYFGCEEDADCATNQRCACHSCVAAECEDDADCGAGEQCRQENWCGWGPNGAFHCTTPQDECRADNDCSEGAYCDFDSEASRFMCESESCSVP
jgi:hypothetical protein